MYKQSIGNIRKEQQEYLFKLENEIVKLEKQIENSKKEDFKRSTIKNLKIVSKVLRFISPYVLVIGSLTGIIKLLGGGLPFYVDDEKKPLFITTSINNKGNIRTERQYFSSFTHSASKAILTYYDEWKKNKNGEYTRNIKKYNLEDISDINKKIYSYNSTNIKDLSKEEIENYVETKNELSTLELSDEEIFEVTIERKSEKDFIIEKEDFDRNTSLTIFWILSNMMSEAVISFSRKFKIGEHINKIKDDYKPLDTDRLIKKLEIKKSNYERLCRK